LSQSPFTQIGGDDLDQDQSNVVIDGPPGRNDRETDDYQGSEQSLDEAKFAEKIGGKQNRGERGKTDQETDGADHASPHVSIAVK
jgi:hypothetical protein